MLIYAIHKPDPKHLAEVIAEMQTLGTPTLHVIDCGDHYQALEGSHRLASAEALGLIPNLIIHADDELLDVSVYDWYKADPDLWPETIYPAADVAYELFSPFQAVSYQFDDDDEDY